MLLKRHLNPNKKSPVFLKQRPIPCLYLPFQVKREVLRKTFQLLQTRRRRCNALSFFFSIGDIPILLSASGFDCSYQVFFLSSSSSSSLSLERSFIRSPSWLVPLGNERTIGSYCRVYEYLTMGRVKLKIKKLDNTNGRQATFGKRKNGILKKAHELSILCDIDLLLLMFSQSLLIAQRLLFWVKKPSSSYVLSWWQTFNVVVHETSLFDELTTSNGDMKPQTNLQEQIVWRYQQTLPPPPVSGTQIMGRSAHLHLMLSSVTTAKFKINVVASTSAATTCTNKSIAITTAHRDSDAITRRFAWAKLSRSFGRTGPGPEKAQKNGPEAQKNLIAWPAAIMQ
ncbi:LOW QUALITY PROTEIN: hypothetical protein HID58_007139 [Brassica napus]|uniref:MADS-box domain-containing protein n=1 Tax=Brassica napus TaxID=3708 RepID=A0ABQ8EE24_BRANA|nr:LOW QUALITY PROTEIN: hypothetical protein HID58_007139 [Brassica napus]